MEDQTRAVRWANWSGDGSDGASGVIVPATAPVYPPMPLPTQTLTPTPAYVSTPPPPVDFRPPPPPYTQPQAHPPAYDATLSQPIQTTKWRQEDVDEYDWPIWSNEPKLGPATQHALLGDGSEPKVMENILFRDMDRSSYKKLSRIRIRRISCFATRVFCLAIIVSALVVVIVVDRQRSAWSEKQKSLDRPEYFSVDQSQQLPPYDWIPDLTQFQVTYIGANPYDRISPGFDIANVWESSGRRYDWIEITYRMRNSTLLPSPGSNVCYVRVTLPGMHASSEPPTQRNWNSNKTNTIIVHRDKLVPNVLYVPALRRMCTLPGDTPDSWWHDVEMKQSSFYTIETVESNHNTRQKITIEFGSWSDTDDLLGNWMTIIAIVSAVIFMTSTLYTDKLDREWKLDRPGVVKQINDACVQRLAQKQQQQQHQHQPQYQQHQYQYRQPGDSGAISSTEMVALHRIGAVVGGGQ